MSWENITLGEISDTIQTGPFGSQLHQSDYSDEGIPVVMPKDLINGHISEASIARVSVGHAERLCRHRIKIGDILYSRRGDVGRCALATEVEQGWLCGTGCLRITIDQSKAVPEFVFYQLQKKETIGWVEKHAVGSTMLNLNTSILSNIPVELPPLDEQYTIVNVLSAYDSLIENNQKQIKLLEEAAQRLYKEWFGDLRFPGHENTKIVDGIPEGWKHETIADLSDTIGGGTPSTKVEEYYRGGDIRWVTPTDITRKKGLILLDSEKKITNEGLQNCSAKIVPPYTILMTSRASVGFFGLCEYEVCTNQGFISCIPRKENTRFYLLYNLMNRVDEIRGKATGSTFLEIGKKTFRGLQIVLPSNDVLDAFEYQIRPIIRRMEEISKSIAMLQEARDRQLPRLMSGEIET